ncbi:MAG: hemolysin family protein [Alphaproteobacteria bacterium]|nr:hemolysin family protein [Alphaproteobacteria bacterium]
MADDSSSLKPREGGAASDSSLLSRLFGLKGSKKHRNGDTVRDTIETLIEDEGAEGSSSIDADERRLIQNILEMREITAEDVMVPRADIVAVEERAQLDDLVRQMSSRAHSRIPVYRETLDDVIGIVHIKDVLRFWGAKRSVPMRRLLRPVLFVSPSMEALELLLEMRRARKHLALVVDEYGGIDGLVTIEDLVEQIVGEIEDEHDIPDTPKIIEQSDGSLTADARATVEDFEELVGEILSEEEREENDTLAGLVVMILGRVPARGECVKHDSGIEFEVADVDPRRVKRLIIRNLPAKHGADDAGS